MFFETTEATSELERQPTLSLLDTSELIGRNNSNNQSTSLAVNSLDPKQADLLIETLETPRKVAIGRSINFYYSIENQGTITADANAVSFFLSEDSLLDSTDLLLGSDETAVLNPGTIQREYTSLSFDNSLNFGDYYLIAQIDSNNSVLESDETNNLLVKTITLTQADLVIESLSALTSVEIGQSFQLNYTIKNQGTNKAAASSTEFYLSQDNLLDTNDLLLGTNLVTSMRPGVAREQGVTLNLSNELESGSYYLLAIVDGSNQILESDETNNSLVEIITINQPIEPNEVTYDPISGYGTVNAAAAVAQALGQTPFSDVPNLGGSNWGADLINVPEVWANGYTGEGIVVAVIDTGVDRNHTDLSRNIWTNSDEIANNGIDDDGNGYVDDVYGWDFADNDNDTTDVRGHGTHVAGTIAATNNNTGVTGIAYDAQIMPIKVFSDQGSGTYDALVRGIYYAVNNGAKVINMSLSGSAVVRELQEAIEYASSRGVITVSAAGNANAATPSYPAYYALSDGLAVGAINSSNQRASFSNQAGNNPDIAYVNAPGVNIYSTLPNNTYGYLSGTSMATPHVAGVVALMLSANSNLTDAQVRQILIQTAVPLG